MPTTIDYSNLLKAVDTLNGPQNGVTNVWKTKLNQSTNQDVINRVTILNSLDAAFNGEMTEFATITDDTTGEEFVTLVEGYLQMTKGLYAFLLKAGNADKQTEKKVRDALRNVADEVQKVKVLLLQQPSPDNLFLTTMASLIGIKLVIGKVTFPVITQGDFTLTRRLFKQERFPSNDPEIKKLIESWDTVIAGFVDNNKSTDNSTDKTIIAEANFLAMHGLLEILYDRLETNVRRTTVEILSSNIG